MSGTAPQSSEPPTTPPGPAAPDVTPGRPRRAGVWLALGLLLVVVLVALLVGRPWSTPGPAPTTPVATPTTPSPPPSPSPSPTPTASPSPVPQPGADAVFDATTAASLFVQRRALEEVLPAAASGLERGREPGEAPWGLPEGTTVDPAACLAAVVVVAEPPTYRDATSWVNDEVDVEQDVVLLPDAAAAREAFRALVTAVDACPEYTRADPGAGSTTWTAKPAIEGQGVFPAIVQEIDAEVEGDEFAQVTGHVLVGNAILTWTATALLPGDVEAGRATLGMPAEIAAVVQARAITAVRALS